MKKYNSGITLMALIITIIVLLIIVSISVYEGKELIAKSMIQSLENNMLIIQAKAKAYAEEIDAKIWTESEKDAKREEEFSQKGFINQSNSIDNKYINIDTSNYVAYTIKPEGLTLMGLDEIKNDQFMVIYDKEDYKKMDVIYKNGVKYKGEDIYTLSKIQEVL